MKRIQSIRSYPFLSKVVLATVVGLAVTLSLLGCSTWKKLDKTEKGAVIGGGTGAVIGGSGGGAGGALLGGAAGAVAGGVIGHNVDDDDD